MTHSSAGEFAQAASKLDLTPRDASILALLARRPDPENDHARALLDELRGSVKEVAEVVLGIRPLHEVSSNVRHLATVYQQWVEARRASSSPADSECCE